MGMPVEIALADSMKSPKSIKILDFQQFSTFCWLSSHLVISTIPNRLDSVENNGNFISNFFKRLWNARFRGKNYPEQRWMVMPVEIALADFMKSPKSMKSIEIHRYPLIPTRPLVVSGVQRWGGKKPETWKFHVRTFFHVANHPETTHNTHNDRANHQNRP